MPDNYVQKKTWDEAMADVPATGQEPVEPKDPKAARKNGGGADK